MQETGMGENAPTRERTRLGGERTRLCSIMSQPNMSQIKMTDYVTRVTEYVTGETDYVTRVTEYVVTHAL